MYTALFETVHTLFVNIDYIVGSKTTNFYLQVKVEASISTIMLKGKFLIAMPTYISDNHVSKRPYSKTCKNQDSEYSFIYLHKYSKTGTQVSAEPFIHLFLNTQFKFNSKSVMLGWLTIKLVSSANKTVLRLNFIFSKSVILGRSLTLRLPN
jgi:hypothetical protein